MAALNIRVCVLVFLASLLNPIACLDQPLRQSKLPAMFVFGDSTFDTGNNNYINTTAFFQGNYWPYGITYFDYPTGRTSDGRVVPDIVGQLAGVPLLPPFLQPGFKDFTIGSNFASVGGAVLVETATGLVIPLKTQVEFFKNVTKQLRSELGVEEANELLTNAVYLFGIGSDDYVSPFSADISFLHQFTHEEYVDMVVGNLTEGIKEVYKEGGRKFGFLGLQNLGCLPVLRIRVPDLSCLEESTTLSKLHNAVFNKKLVELEKELEGFMYANFEFYNASSDRMFNPTKYGLEVGTDACCGIGPLRGNNTCGGKRADLPYEQCPDPSKYLLWDSGRYTDEVSRQFAEIWWNGTIDEVWPYNVKALFEHTSSSYRERIELSSSI